MQIFRFKIIAKKYKLAILDATSSWFKVLHAKPSLKSHRGICLVITLIGNWELVAMM